MIKKLAARLLSATILLTLAASPTPRAWADAEPAFAPDLVESELIDSWIGGGASRSSNSVPGPILQNAARSQHNYADLGFDVLAADVNITHLAENLWQVYTTLDLKDSAGHSQAAWGEYYRIEPSSPTDTEIAADEDVFRAEEAAVSTDEQHFEPARSASSDTRPAMIPEGNFFKDTGTQITPMARALPGLNYYAMVRWALDYTASNTLSEYYGDAGNNCANFASQVLNAGGWPAHRDISMRVRLIR